MRLRLAAVALVSLLAAACGGEEEGKATLWVTNDRGTKVVLVREVAAGQTALQALDEAADVETRYGGRFVQAVDGLSGSLSGRRDWFYFVNGIEGDRGAGEYRLRPGDVLWWDYRSWAETMRAPVVVGAFPEPFIHGYDGDRRPAWVLYRAAGLEPAARAIARPLRARVTTRRPPEDANVLEVTGDAAPFRATAGGAGGPVRFLISSPDALRLARNPRLARFRYEGLP